MACFNRFVFWYAVCCTIYPFNITTYDYNGLKNWLQSVTQVKKDPKFWKFSNEISKREWLEWHPQRSYMDIIIVSRSYVWSSFVYRILVWCWIGRGLCSFLYWNVLMMLRQLYDLFGPSVWPSTVAKIVVFVCCSLSRSFHFKNLWFSFA